MRKLYLLIFLVLAVVAGATAFVQRDFSKVQIKATEVAGNVYMLEGSGGNIGVSIGEDGVLMVDSQFAPLADKIKAAIKDLGGDLPKFLLNTHWHGDHTGSNEIFGTESIIVAHTNVRTRLSAEHIRGDRTTPPTPEAAWPVITFDESLSFHFNGEEVEVMHYPKGHTDGDAVIYFTGSNVVHMGDHWFSGIFPFVDLDSGGTVQGYTANIKKILADVKPDAKFIPGHGPLSTFDDLKKNLRMLEETSTLVTSQMKQGKTLDEIKSEGLQDEWKAWSWDFISEQRWIETIYNSYSN